MGKRKPKIRRMGDWNKRNLICKGCNQYSNTPILHYSISILLGAGRFFWVL